MADNSARQSPETLPSADEFDEPDAAASFPVVGVGASAGGLEAFAQLLKALPADTGTALVLVQHLAPSHPSALAEILSRATKMPVPEVRDEPTVEPNRVYVIPPDRSIIIVPRGGGNSCRALAAELRHRAIPTGCVDFVLPPVDFGSGLRYSSLRGSPRKTNAKFEKHTRTGPFRDEKLFEEAADSYTRN